MKNKLDFFEVVKYTSHLSHPRRSQKIFKQNDRRIESESELGGTFKTCIDRKVAVAAPWRCEAFFITSINEYE